MQSRGQISAGKFSKDCGAGYPSVHSDKSLSKWQVMEYAEKTFGAVRETPVAIDMSAKKARLEVEKLEQDVEKGKLANRKEDDKWLYKEEAWAQMAAIIGKLRDSLRHQFHVGTVAIITSSAGDPQRGPEVYETAEGLISRAFNEIVESGRIEGVFSKTGEEV
ncbi:MAG: hypothetical protein HGA20_15070 [Geobacteraceae bacterium]|nr:hypothetical protein [Geobacteraceae bacterium]